MWCIDTFYTAVLSELFQCWSRACLQRTLVSQTFDRSPHIPSSAPVFLFMSSSSICFQLSPFLCLFPSSLTHCLSAIFLLLFFFLYKVCESAITETPSFSAQAAKFILVVFRVFILGFLEGRHICGKTKWPGAGAFPLGIMAAQGKNRRVFFWEMELRIGERLPRVPLSQSWDRTGDHHHHSFIPLFVCLLFYVFLSFHSTEHVKTTIWVLF